MILSLLLFSRRYLLALKVLGIWTMLSFFWIAVPARKLLYFDYILAWILFAISDRLPVIWEEYLLLRNDSTWLSRDACTFLLLGLYISQDQSKASQEDTSERSKGTGSGQSSQEVSSSHSDETEKSFWSEVCFQNEADL